MTEQTVFFLHVFLCVCFPLCVLSLPQRALFGMVCVQLQGVCRLWAQVCTARLCLQTQPGSFERPVVSWCACLCWELHARQLHYLYGGPGFKISLKDLRFLHLCVLRWWLHSCSTSDISFQYLQKNRNDQDPCNYEQADMFALTINDNSCGHHSRILRNVFPPFSTVACLSKGFDCFVWRVHGLVWVQGLPCLSSWDVLLFSLAYSVEWRGALICCKL